MTRDKYDVEVAFDDLYGDESSDCASTRESLAYAAGSILARAKRDRLNPPVTVECVGGDATSRTFKHYSYPVLGGSSLVACGHHPFYDAIRGKFEAALPKPALVRVDTEKTYVGFREERRASHVEELAKRLSALEQAFSQHVSDGHGAHWGDVAKFFDGYAQDHKDVDLLGAEVEQAAHAAAAGGLRVPLDLPSWAAGKVECWQDGDEVLCTVRLPGPDGRARLATTGAQVRDVFEDVLGHACVLGADLDSVLAIGGPLGCVISGERMVRQLCRAAPQLLSQPEVLSGDTFVGAMRPTTNPHVAAAMALLQRCQRGEHAACAELGSMLPTNQALLEDAHDRLVRAQHEKSRRMS